MSSEGIPLSAFKECDIRGEFGAEVTPGVAYRLGRAVGSVTRNPEVVVGGDFRVSTPILLKEIKRGLVESGAVVFDLGQVSTPFYYFARRRLGIEAGVMVTASHSPVAYNGFKPILGKIPITPEELEDLKRLVVRGPFSCGKGEIRKIALKEEYVRWLTARFSDLAESRLSAVFDCGNGAIGWVMHDVLKSLRIKAHVMFPEPDGTFPNRSPDISGPEDLSLLQAEVKECGASIGAGFDGDGDRVGFVDDRGHRIPSDLLVAWLAREMLKKEPGGKVVYDIKLSKVVPETVEREKGIPVVQKSGHTFIKAAMLESGAVIGGEYTGHLFYRELEGGDDGLFSALLVCSLLTRAEKPFSEMLADLPRYPSTPDLRVRYGGDKKTVIQKAIASAKGLGARLVLVDGVKAEFDRGWALIRASVTEPALTFRFEGNTVSDLLDIAKQFLEGLDNLGIQVWEQVLAHKNRSL
jgi:phosphomannomutase/phosphoglucomutase